MEFYCYVLIGAFESVTPSPAVAFFFSKLYNVSVNTVADNVFWQLIIVSNLLMFPGWDSDMSSILILVHLLPPSPHGRKRPGKLSARQACDHLVKFVKVKLQ